MADTEVSTVGASAANSAPAVPPVAVLSTKQAELGYVERSEISTDLGVGTGPGNRRTSITTASTPSSSIAASSKPKPPSKTKGFFSGWHSTEPNPRFGGISNNTVANICYLFIAMGVTAVAWYFSLQAVLKSPLPPQDEDSYDGDGGVGNPGTSVVFIHLAFASAVLILLLFVERTIAQARVDRKAFKEPQDVLPRYNTFESVGGGGITGIARTPSSRLRPLWLANRRREGTSGESLREHGPDQPKVPGPPPPAYGNTRGSVLLLSGIQGVDDGEGSEASSRRSSLRTPPGSPPAR